MSVQLLAHFTGSFLRIFLDLRSRLDCLNGIVPVA